ncbi:hypothetical protein [Methylocystis echinoides]|uniref:hypothetical protein n=1 Tax=Methylocystis echinoides TaxID=29468 RepID=UPI0034257789
MERRAIAELVGTARVYGPEELEWAVRRRRLERLASVLESTREPVKLFSTMECYPRRERLTLRMEHSPLAVAYHDAQFRREGLTGDSVGEGMAFFNLSMREAHALLCDCGYGGFSLLRMPLSSLIARRARKLAAKRNLAEWRELAASWMDAATSRLSAWKKHTA